MLFLTRDTGFVCLFHGHEIFFLWYYGLFVHRLKHFLIHTLPFLLQSALPSGLLGFYRNHSLLLQSSQAGIIFPVFFFLSIFTNCLPSCSFWSASRVPNSRRFWITLCLRFGIVVHFWRNSWKSSFFVVSEHFIFYHLSG